LWDIGEEPPRPFRGGGSGALSFWKGGALLGHHHTTRANIMSAIRAAAADEIVANPENRNTKKKESENT
jgi:hypothetical protein